MSKWNYELTIDIGREEYVLYLIEDVIWVNQFETAQTSRKNVREKKEIRRFHKDCDMDWMLKEMNNHMEILKETFVPSDTYQSEFVGDRFVGNYESNILLIKDRIDRKEVIVIGKTYTLKHRDMTVKALNAYKEETIE